MKLKNNFYKLLKKSEKYTKTDMIYLAKGGFWLSFGQTVSAVASFLLAIAFANLLPKETYGTYKYILSLLGLLAIPTLTGMGTAIVRSVAQGNDGNFIPAIKTKIRWGVWGGLASLLLAGYYFYLGDMTLVGAFCLSAIFIPFMDSLAEYSSLLQGKKKFDVSSKYGIFIKILASLSIFITLYLTKNLLAILAVYLASYTFLRLIAFKFSLKYIQNSNQGSQTINYGKHLSLMSLIGIVASQIDKVLVFNLLGSVPLAIYSIAIAMPEQAKGILKFSIGLALPKFSEKEPQQIQKTLYYKTFIYFLFLVLAVLIYILLAPILFKILFPKYLESLLYSQIFSISLIFTSATLPIAYLTSLGKKKILYKYNLTTSIVLIILTILLVYFWGLWGLIWARIIFRFFNFILAIVMAKKN